MDPRIERVLEKLKEAKRSRAECFGSECHGFRLQPPLSETAIEKFEGEHNIRLPDDFRLFLLEAGSSGAGPYYGLLPMERWAEHLSEEPGPQTLASPCPLRHKEEYPSVEADASLQGTLAVVHQGCVYYALLVVSGEHRGRIVYIDLDGSGSPYFVDNPDFMSWYERWLDELLAGYDTDWFGVGLAGTEEDLVRIASEETHDLNRRSEALSTIRRLPKVSSKTVETLRRSAHDPAASVRCEAVLCLGHFGIVEGEEDLRARMGDQDAEVRKAVVSSLEQILGRRSVEPIKLLLADQDPKVVVSAIYALENLDALLVEDLRPLLSSGDSKLRQTVVQALGKASGSAEELLMGELEHQDTRVNAIQALRDLKSRAAAPLLVRLFSSTSDDLIRSNCLHALQHIGGKEALELLISATQDSDPFIRFDAAHALGELNDPAALPALEALVSDSTMPSRETEYGHTATSWSVGEQARKAIRKICKTKGKPEKTGKRRKGKRRR